LSVEPVASSPGAAAQKLMAQVGAVFAITFASDSPHVLAAAGAKGEVAVWDMRGCAPVMAKYPQLLGGGQQQRQQDAAQ
jgi:hypothetical protein